MNCKTAHTSKVFFIFVENERDLQMIEHYTIGNFWFPLMYVVATVTAIYASLYLFFRKGNAYEPGIQSPVRLRRCAAIFIATIALSHIWWKVFYYDLIAADVTPSTELCILLDALISLPAMMFTLFAMLQDRKRPVWPILLVEGLALLDICLFFFTDKTYTPLVIIVFCSLMAFVIFMGWRYVREYQSWLSENYADLEHKEIVTSMIVLIAFMLTPIIYNFFILDTRYDIIIELMDIALIFILLWRVETLQTLKEPETQPQDTASAPVDVFSKIEILLQKHCVEEQYYLRHDVSLSQLAGLIGTNRTYLSQYFSRTGQSYNSYINGLRVQHFIRLYDEALSTGRIFTANQLSFESGFQSYITFGTAFKKAKGQTVTAWMHSHQPA